MWSICGFRLQHPCDYDIITTTCLLLHGVQAMLVERVLGLLLAIFLFIDVLLVQHCSEYSGFVYDSFGLDWLEGTMCVLSNIAIDGKRRSSMSAGHT